MSLTIIHLPEKQRFEHQQNGLVAHLDYRIQDEHTLIFSHTIVPPQLEGQGIASALTRHALDYAREHGKKVVPACSFVATWIQRHPEYSDLQA